MRRRRIYLDLDGVMFDFDLHAKNVLGENPRTFEKEYGSNVYWKQLNLVTDFLPHHAAHE